MKKAAFLLSGLLLSTAGMATADCSIKLRQDISVDNQSMRITGQGKTLYEIRQGGHLSIDGKVLELSRRQRVMAEEYAGEIAALVPRWITMVSEALVLTESSLALALGDAFGPDSDASVKATGAVALARENFERRAISGNGEYQLSASTYNDLDESLEEELEDTFRSAMSAVLAEIGRSLASDEGSLVEKMDAFGEHMKRAGDAMGNAGEALEETGAELCISMKDIQKLEREIVKEIPQLAEYPLFD
jgi:hypothetical protein